MSSSSSCSARPARPRLLPAPPREYARSSPIAEATTSGHPDGPSARRDIPLATKLRVPGRAGRAVGRSPAGGGDPTRHVPVRPRRGCRRVRPPAGSPSARPQRDTGGLPSPGWWPCARRCRWHFPRRPEPRSQPFGEAPARHERVRPPAVPRPGPLPRPRRYPSRPPRSRLARRLTFRGVASSYRREEHTGRTTTTRPGKRKRKEPPWKRASTRSPTPS